MRLFSNAYLTALGEVYLSAGNNDLTSLQARGYLYAGFVASATTYYIPQLCGAIFNHKYLWPAGRAYQCGARNADSFPACYIVKGNAAVHAGFQGRRLIVTNQDLHGVIM